MGFGMARKLSVRQRKFASLVAEGKTQIAAYEEAGYSTKGKRETAGRNARQLAQHAEVRANIEEMRDRLLPSPGDLRKINEHALAVIVGLSQDARDEKVRLQAAEWLHEETGRQIAERERLAKIEQQRGPRRESDQQIIHELRMLYAKALPGLEPPLLEAVSDGAPDDQAGEAPAENRPLAEPARAEDEAPEPGEVKVSSGAEHLKPPVQFRMERIPGYFPARYRRVPIEP